VLPAPNNDGLLWDARFVTGPGFVGVRLPRLRRLVEGLRR